MMNNNELIERWETLNNYYALLPDDRSNKLYDAIMDTITALSPVQSGEVANEVRYLRFEHCNRAADLMERQGRENALLLKTNADHAERIDTYTDRIDELEAEYGDFVTHAGTMQDIIDELEAKIKTAGDILAEHQTLTAPTYLFNAIAALQENE